MSRPPRLGAQLAQQRLAALEGWAIEGDTLAKTYAFRDYHHTMAFVNAVAWIAHRADHHPDLAVGYNRCRVAWSTHDAGGLTDYDFACAAQCDALLPAP